MNTFQNIPNHFDGFSGSPDGLGATLRVLGDDELQPQEIEVNPARKMLVAAYAIAGVAGAAIGAYHGYKRNDSVGWAIGWAFLGSLFPVIVIPVAFAQGIGEREK